MVSNSNDDSPEIQITPAKNLSPLVPPDSEPAELESPEKGIIAGFGKMNLTGLRVKWMLQSDLELLTECNVDTYRASGPGGQKRNKTSSAVRLRHIPSGIIVIAEESRSQHENKAKALKRLRCAFALHCREELSLAKLNNKDLREFYFKELGFLESEKKDSQNNSLSRKSNQDHPKTEESHIIDSQEPWLSINRWSPKQIGYWLISAIVLDILVACSGRIGESVSCLGISTGQWIDFCQQDGKLWQEVNRIRQLFKLKPLKMT